MFARGIAAAEGKSTGVAAAAAAARALQKERGLYDWDHVVRQWVEERLEDTEDFFNAAKLELATFSGRGCGLRAKESIPRGTLLLVERPLAYQRLDRLLAGPAQPPAPLAEEIVERARADPAVAQKLATLMGVKPSAVLGDAAGMRRRPRRTAGPFGTRLSLRCGGIRAASSIAAVC